MIDLLTSLVSPLHRNALLCGVCKPNVRYSFDVLTSGSNGSVHGAFRGVFGAVGVRGVDWNRRSGEEGFIKVFVLRGSFNSPSRSLIGLYL